jgi:hypothetical protein
VGGSPAPSWSPSLSVEAEAEADDEANILAKPKAVADILAEAESDGSPGYVMTDSKDDRLHGYAMPVLPGLNLFLHISPYDCLVCPFAQP